tara:strand:+ start:59 stop:748 length:690 start_codon:yes stop_codon:yes gene_type:complete
MTLIAFLLSTLSVAQETPANVPIESQIETPLNELPNEEIVVVAHREYEVYVAPIQYHITDASINASVPKQMVFNYTGTHSRNSKVQARYKTWEPITMHGGMKVYNEDTIKYTWDNCDYSVDHRKCSFQNSHYFLETYVTVDENELNISMALFDPNMQVLNASSVSDLSTIIWIKQQELTVIQEQSMMGSRTTIHKPKEELPLKWVIPPRLLTSMVRQASIRVWTGVRLD